MGNRSLRAKKSAPLAVAGPDFRALFEAAPGLFLVLTPDLTIVAVSDAHLKATMTRREEVLGCGVFEVFPDNPDDPVADGSRNLRASLDKVFASRTADTMDVIKYDIRKPESEGGGFEERFWRVVNSPVLDLSGEVSFIVNQAEDVTASVRVEKIAAERTRAQEEIGRYRQLFESNPQPMWVFDDETLAFLEVNEAACLHYGHSREEFLGMTLRDIRPPEDVPGLLSRLADEPQEYQNAGVWRHLRRDGAVIEVEIASHPLVFAGRKAQLVLAVDVTDRRRLEEQLRQSQKMEAIGQLAGGVAHDFNNILTVILGYAELLSAQLGDEALLLDSVHEIYDAGERAATLTRQLLAFSRRQVLEQRALDLNAIVRKIERMLRRVLGENVVLVTSLDPELDPVRADAGQIEQVLLNLAVNARDAMPNGGELAIMTANVNLDEAYGQTHISVAPGSYSIISVSDTGVGMDPATMARVFEPFFTTKEHGRGTGLGLSTVFGIVKQSGGHIWPYSEPGKGTTFRIYLPRIDEPAEPVGAPREVEPTEGGTERILLVEDEDSIRALARRILEAKGYRVTEAAHGDEAFQAAWRASEPFQLLITDLVLPGLSGPEIATRVQRIFPKVKVLFTSGYSDNVAFRQDLMKTDAAFLAKPFTPTALSRRVREVLDSDSETIRLN